MSIEAMKQALDCLQAAYNLQQIDDLIPAHAPVKQAVSALRQAIVRVEKQEPVAWMYEVNGAHTILDLFEPPDDAYDEGTLYPLYTTPQPQREWVGLTDEEVVNLVDDEDWYNDPEGFVKIVEAKLKEKNT